LFLRRSCLCLWTSPQAAESPIHLPDRAHLPHTALVYPGIAYKDGVLSDGKPDYDERASAVEARTGEVLANSRISPDSTSAKHHHLKDRLLIDWKSEKGFIYYLASFTPKAIPLPRRSWG